MPRPPRASRVRCANHEQVRLLSLGTYTALIAFQCSAYEAVRCGSTTCYSTRVCVATAIRLVVILYVRGCAVAQPHFHCPPQCLPLVQAAQIVSCAQWSQQDQPGDHDAAAPVRSPSPPCFNSSTRTAIIGTVTERRCASTQRDPCGVVPDIHLACFQEAQPPSIWLLRA